MKDIETMQVERPVAEEGFANRKLIRPSLNHNHNHAPAAAGERRERPERSERPERGDRNNGRKPVPPEQTNAENFYYQKQMQSKTAMVVTLSDGEELHGTIEWYDKNCIKLIRNGAPNLMVYKSCIKYMHKEAESNGRK